MGTELILVVGVALLVLSGLGYALWRQRRSGHDEEPLSKAPKNQRRRPNREIPIPRTAPTGSGITPGIDELLGEERFEEAARLAMRHRNWNEAMDCYLRAEQPANAGHAARLGGSFQRAAELFEQCGDFEAAAGCLQRHGDKAGASKMREAGRQARKTERAARKRSRSPAGGTATPSGGQSIAELRAIIGGGRCDLGNIEAYYRLALALEGAGQRGEAREAFAAVEETSPGYRDAEARAVQLEAGE